MKKRLIKSCIWGVALYGPETWTLGKNKERVINAFETWCWRRILALRLLMSYIYGAPILDVSRSHTTTQHSR